MTKPSLLGLTSCRGCGQPLDGSDRSVYCKPSCRQKTYRRAEQARIERQVTKAAAKLAVTQVEANAERRDEHFLGTAIANLVQQAETVDLAWWNDISPNIRTRSDESRDAVKRGRTHIFLLVRTIRELGRKMGPDQDDPALEQP